MTRARLRFLILLVLLFGAWILLKQLPHPRLQEGIPLSTVIYDRNGVPLRLTLASDDQFRLWVPLDQMDPDLIEAVQLYEDRWFDWHPGVNPIALIRASVRTYAKGDRQGGSTLTMQLSRRWYRIKSQTLSGKIKQIGAALWLESRYSKREILEAYLNLAPYGGNIEGIETASQIYLHKSAKDLTLPEALTLAVIPQNPQRRGVRRLEDPSLWEARKRLFELWVKRHPEAERYRAEMEHPLPFFSLKDLPFLAPHFSHKIFRDHALRVGPKNSAIYSTLDLRLQTLLERSITQFLKQQTQGVQNASALLINRENGEVLAYVGSADYFNRSIQGQVDGIDAKRSPGSTLKPFIYALALDQGLIHPRTILKDKPTAFGPFSPENFDGRFMGPISAQEALIRSRNIPALTVAAKLSNPNLYEFLKKAGVRQMASESHYGLALTLGGGEISIEELARLYLMLAQGGKRIPLVSILDQKNDRAVENLSSKKDQLLSEEATFITLKMLEENPRPDTGLPAIPKVAWKTGTSWGFRDSWTAGVWGRYVLVVWNGNFDGTGNPALVGIRTTAPLFFKIVDTIRAQGLDPGEIEKPIPSGISQVEICIESGDLPNRWCPEKGLGWFIPGKSPIQLSTLHQPVKIDAKTGRAVCEDGPGVETQIFEFWPTDLQRLFRSAGLPRRSPPDLPDCSGIQTPSSGNGPEITSPQKNLSYLLKISNPQPLTLRADAPAESGTLFWFIDDGWIGQSRAGIGLTWAPAQAGRYQIRVVDSLGRGSHQEVVVEFMP